MKSWLASYARYNEWANRRLLDYLLQCGLPIESAQVSSFPGIMSTVMHMWDAEYIWWQRMKLSDQFDKPSDFFSGDLAALCKQFLQQSAQWSEWAGSATEAAVAHEFIYRNTKKEQFKQPVSEVMVHLFNHQSYHRGQIITMLRQLGADKLPGLDYILFCRKGK